MPQTTLTRRSFSIADLDIPVLDITGSGDGPQLTLLAGVHGCEYASMAALRIWANGLAGRELRGRVLAVPVLNLPSFRARTPFVVPNDGKNLNRCFPGNPSGSLADRIAADTFTKIIKGSDALIDMHAGDMVEALQPFALYDAGPAEARARDMATAYGLRYVIRQEPGPDRAVGGTSSAAAAEIGIPAIIAEAGGCGLVERPAVEAHVRGLNRMLAFLGMADGAVSDGAVSDGVASDGSASDGSVSDGSVSDGSVSDGSVSDGSGDGQTTYLRRFLWLRCRDEGWWEPSAQAGEWVAAGQVIGTVSSIDGTQTLETIVAPADGVLIFVTSSPAVAADGLLLGLGAR